MHKNELLVTVGVASYNNAAYVGETLDSIAAQTYKNIELIVVDDCSTDDSVRVITDWLAANPNVDARLIQHQPNKGVSAVYNRILAEAKGEYLSIVGSDDVYLPEKTSHQLAELAPLSQDYAVICSDMYVIDKNGLEEPMTHLKSLDAGFNPFEGQIFESLLIQNRVCAPSIMMVTKAVRDIGGYDESLSFEDWDMWLRLSRKYSIKFSNFISVKYRVLSTSAWNSRGVRFYESSIRTLVKHLGISKEYDSIILTHIINYAELIYILGDYRAAKWLNFAFLKMPTFRTGLLTTMATLRIPYIYYDKLYRLKKNS